MGVGYNNIESHVSSLLAAPFRPLRTPRPCVPDSEVVARRCCPADTIWEIVTIAKERQNPSTSLTMSVSTSDIWTDYPGVSFVNEAPPQERVVYSHA